MSSIGKTEMGERKKVFFLFSLFIFLILPACMETWEDGDRYESRRFPVTAYCEANVQGTGWVDTETDYVPHVVACENGAAPFEALKAQAVTARTFLYYKMEGEGSIGDGQHDQVYTCANQPQQIHYDAAAATQGQILRYSGVTICSFYVAGAIPSTGDCIPAPGDSDPHDTEKWVTYNEGLSGDDIEQSPLGWVDPSNVYNRGCMSQNGASCLDNVAGYNHLQILNFYYGEDIVVETAVGPCVDPVWEDASVPIDSEVVQDAGIQEDAELEVDAGEVAVDGGDIEDGEVQQPEDGGVVDSGEGGGSKDGFTGGCGCRTFGTLGGGGKMSADELASSQSSVFDFLFAYWPLVFLICFLLYSKHTFYKRES